LRAWIHNYAGNMESQQQARVQRDLRTCAAQSGCDEPRRAVSRTETPWPDTPGRYGAEGNAGRGIAETYAWRGEKDNAFACLEWVFQQRDKDLPEINDDLLLAPLRDGARFGTILRKKQLPE
jgi:hypothetical protein